MRLVSTDLDARPEDIDAVAKVAFDYIDGYTQGDADRHARAYHPECVKRRYIVDGDSGVTELQQVPPCTMVDYAAKVAAIDDCEGEIFIDAISEDMASIRIYSCQWVDFAHVVKARGAWKLFHVTWHGRNDR